MDENSSSNFKAFLIPLSIILTGLMFSVGILYSANSFVKRDEIVTKEYLKKTVYDIVNGTSTASTGNNTEPTKVSTTIDNDPVMGDKSKAKVAIVEYSDFECPYCKDFYNGAYSQIKKEYVDTGKAIFVYRDFPLNIHNPLATKQAYAAECIQELGGDKKFFEFHDLIFKNTKTGGNGLDVAQLYEYSKSLGVDEIQFKSCYESEKYKDDIAKDIEDGKKASINGTPGFVIGKLNSEGAVDGVLLMGPQPFDSFKSIIDSQLQ